MNRKQLIISLFVLAVIGLSIYFLIKEDSSSWNSSKYSATGENLFGDLDVNNIASFTVSSGARTATLRKNEDGSWIVSEKDSYQGDYRKIINFLKNLMEIKSIQNINAVKSQLEKLSLGDSDREKGTAVLVEFSGDAGRKMASLLIGKKHFKKEENPNPFLGGATPDGCYVMICDGKFQPKLVNNSFEGANPDPLSWTDKTLFEIDNMNTIEVKRKNPEENWKIAKDAQSGKLTLPDLKEDETLDDAKLQPLNGFFKNTSFMDVKTCPADFAGETVKIETADGFKYEINFAPSEGNAEKYLVNVRTSAVIPEQRESGKDEKPEDKEKLDNEFKAKNENLKEKLEHEKSLAKWLYTVSKGDLSQVLKARKEFLKTKEEKKDEALKTAEPPKAE
ncbi:MAG TPA: hypothetical protein DCZ94_07500 [Lentisphaeria bacterium]|nr:MAG: hypothetical protein A2X48_14175 [Lentisphaerae bacterium GWF2_49_21]HBC86781.1 hypothetical protein [Lentisphaeria bacterium]